MLRNGYNNTNSLSKVVQGKSKIGATISLFIKEYGRPKLTPHKRRNIFISCWVGGWWGGDPASLPEVDKFFISRLSSALSDLCNPPGVPQDISHRTCPELCVDRETAVGISSREKPALGAPGALCIMQF